MSMYFCADCDELRDADDGCDEASPGSTRLICVDCMEARDAEYEDPSPPSEELGATGTDWRRDEP